MIDLAVKIIITGAITAALGGCVSMTSGSWQDVRLESTPPGADCTLSNEYGAWKATAPAVVRVHRSATPLTVDCRLGSMTGRESVARVDSNRELISFLGGGLIGRSIDRDSGAAYAYPDVITIKMEDVK